MCWVFHPRTRVPLAVRRERLRFRDGADRRRTAEGHEAQGGHVHKIPEIPELPVSPRAAALVSGG